MPIPTTTASNPGPGTSMDPNERIGGYAGLADQFSHRSFKKCLATNGADMILRHWLRYIVVRILDR